MKPATTSRFIYSGALILIYSLHFEYSDRPYGVMAKIFVTKSFRRAIEYIVDDYNLCSVSGIADLIIKSGGK